MLTGPLDKVMKPYTKKDFWVNSYIMALEKKLPKQERRKTNIYFFFCLAFMESHNLCV